MVCVQGYRRLTMPSGIGRADLRAANASAAAAGECGDGARCRRRRSWWATQTRRRRHQGVPDVSAGAAIGRAGPVIGVTGRARCRRAVHRNGDRARRANHAADHAAAEGAGPAAAMVVMKKEPARLRHRGRSKESGNKRYGAEKS